MCFNEGKFQLIRHGENQELKENTCCFTEKKNEVIEQVSSNEDMGVSLTDDAEFEKICKKARQKSGGLFRTFFTRKSMFIKKKFITLVQPHVDFCSQLWA